MKSGTYRLVRRTVPDYEGFVKGTVPDYEGFVKRTVPDYEGFVKGTVPDYEGVVKGTVPGVSGKEGIEMWGEYIYNDHIEMPEGGRCGRE